MSDNPTDKYQSVEQQLSYGIGRQVGDQLAAGPFDQIDLESLIDGVTDVFNGAESRLDPAVMKAAFEQVNQRIEAQKAEDEKNQGAAGVEFLETNAKREEIQITESGLQYEILNEGDGDKPGAASKVRTHYHGTLIDGTVFDSSYQRGQPAEFPVNGVIAGWTEALQMMQEGAKWRLYIPHQLAYGERGAGGAIAPYSTLIFDVELLAIVG